MLNERSQTQSSYIVWFYLYKMSIAAAVAALLQSCLTLCDPIDGSPPGSPVPGILQATTLEWVAISFSNAWNKSESEVAQSCPTPSDPLDCSLPGSSIHGIFKARVLEWVTIAFSIITPRHNQLDHIFLFLISSQHFSNNAEHWFPGIYLCMIFIQIDLHWNWTL